ncbi:hypothetical protein DFH07DRAFT_904248 [Mycena maculata]|uniref:NAD(P)-binding protein n=1 Tax=Mycena maculata TaxID=230809 RepID=A0AAD7N9A1_9AGAR|nr:hypothetical protein DFH07DRAFT_904248 [Mycena maculata]
MPLFQPILSPLPNSLSFAGKSAIVTGANRGLGRAAALHLSQRHISTLILAVRTIRNGDTTKAALLADPVVQTRPVQPIILVYELDLERPSSVASFASKIRTEVAALDILLLNAGGGSLRWETTPETHTERMFQVNFLSNAILCVRLLPLLRATAERTGSPSHLSFVGSRTLIDNTFTKYPVPEGTSIFAFLNDPAKFRMMRYPDSKLLVFLWSHSLAMRTDAARVIVNSVCPGMVEADMSHQSWWVRNIFYILFWIRGRSQEVGSRALVGALAAGLETHGKMLWDYTVWPNEARLGKEMEERLWDETLAAAESVTPGSVEEAQLKD